MEPKPITIVRESTSRSGLAALAEQSFGDMVKAVVDVARGVMPSGDSFRRMRNAAHGRWLRAGRPLGINLYPAESGENRIEFDPMINVRPSRKTGAVR
ncbi:MAG TPA: DUF5674 family protein [Gemmatimonadaceae bacterium]